MTQHAGTVQDPIPQYFLFCKTVDGVKKYYKVGANSIGGDGDGSTGLSPFKLINSTDEIDETANCIYVLKK